jgi:hypothetical protein
MVYLILPLNKEVDIEGKHGNESAAYAEVAETELAETEVAETEVAETELAETELVDVVEAATQDITKK